MNPNDISIQVPPGLTEEQEEKFIYQWEVKNFEEIKKNYLYRCEQRQAYAALTKSGWTNKYFTARIWMYDSVDNQIIDRIMNNGFLPNVNKLKEERPVNGNQQNVWDEIFYLHQTLYAIKLNETLPPEKEFLLNFLNIKMCQILN